MAAVTTNIQIVSFALILVPVCEFIKGLFQGFQSMGPSALSVVGRAIFSGINHLDRKLCRYIYFKSFYLTSCWYFNIRCFYGSDRWTNCFKCVLHERRKHLKKKKWQVYHKQRNLFLTLLRTLYIFNTICCGWFSNSVVSDD